MLKTKNDFGILNITQCVFLGGFFLPTLIILVPVPLITVLCGGVVGREASTCLAAGAEQMAKAAVTQVAPAKSL